MALDLKKLNPSFPAVSRFFDSNAVKNIFDNVRNLVLSAAVIIGGHYVSTQAISMSQHPAITLNLGYLLITTGVALLGLNIFHGHYLMSKSIPALVSWLASVIYTSLAVQLVFSILLSKGITLTWLST